MSPVRVHAFAVSLDGYGAGPDQSVDDPLGVGGADVRLGGGPVGSECAELVGTPSAAHVRLVRADD